MPPRTGASSKTLLRCSASTTVRSGSVVAHNSPSCWEAGARTWVHNPPSCWEGWGRRSLLRMAQGPDLFSVALQERLTRRAPLAARLRPATLDEVVGQRHLLGPGRPLRVLTTSDRM